MYWAVLARFPFPEFHSPSPEVTACFSNSNCCKGQLNDFFRRRAIMPTINRCL